MESKQLTSLLSGTVMRVIHRFPKAKSSRFPGAKRAQRAPHGTQGRGGALEEGAAGEAAPAVGGIVWTPAGESGACEWQRALTPTPKQMVMNVVFFCRGQ